MIGEQLGSFRIEEKIGAGAMGVVYRATNVKTGRPVAVKVVSADQAARGNAGERFDREAEILMNLKHPNIVRWQGHGRYQGTRYFAMELVEGQTLDAMLSSRGPLPWLEVVRISEQVCGALEAAHSMPVVHRDLKPSNIMVTPSGQVKLTDFGIAKALELEQLTATGRTLGTAAYMAPEQIRGTPEVSHKTDLYALGCLMYQMLTNEPPFRGGQLAVLMNQHLTEPPPRPSTRVPEIPRELDRLVTKLMAKEPAERPWDAQVVAVKLGELREKAERGESIRMAFDPAGVPEPVTSGTGTGASAGPDTSRSGLGPAVGSRSQTLAGSSTGATAAKSKPSSRKPGRRGAGAGAAQAGWWPPSPATLGLVGALAAGLALAVYLLKPPSAEELYRKALPLLGSDQYSDWTTARDRYFAELDRRHPDHPYQSERTALNDRIALYEAKGKARRLQSPFGKPQDEAESLFVQAATKAAEAVKAHDLDFAARVWDALAVSVERDLPGGTGTRGWQLLARSQADEQRQTIARLRKEATDLIAEATAAASAGRDEYAASLRQKVLDDYARYPFLADLVRLAGGDPTAPDPPAAAPGAGFQP